jgi:hypothetical protein
MKNIHDPPKGVISHFGGFIRALSGNSFSCLPPEGLEFR